MGLLQSAWTMLGYLTMFSRWRPVALLVAALLAIPSGALARAAYVCSMTGQHTFSKCCCASAKPKLKSKATSDDACEPARLHGKNCCDRVQSSDGEQATLASALVDAPGAAFVARLDMSELLPDPAPRGLSRWWRSRGPPAHGPPLYIRHCTLLN